VNDRGTAEGGSAVVHKFGGSHAYPVAARIPHTSVLCLLVHDVGQVWPIYPLPTIVKRQLYVRGYL